MAARTDRAKLLLQILADGQWHSYAAVRVQLTKTVHPGDGSRTTEGQRRRVSKTGLPRQRHLSPENEVLIGQLAIADDTVRAYIRSGKVELRGRGSRRKGVEDTREVRLVHSDSLSVGQAAQQLNRSDTTLHKWLRQPHVIAAVKAAITDPTVPPVVYVGSAARIPQAAIAAWERATATRVRPTKDPFDAVVVAVADVFDLDQSTAYLRTLEFMRRLTRVNLIIRRYGEGPITPPTAPAEEADTVS